MMGKLKLFAGVAMLAISACGEGQTDGHNAHQAVENSAANPATDKIAWLSQLMFIRGHLYSGASLYAAGDKEGAIVHMKHPEDELYADLQPAFAAWGAKEFATELQALASSVEGAAAPDRVEADLDTVRAAIDAAADAANPTPKELLLASAATLRTSGKEFDLAVDGTRVVNAREYQDAHGFMTTALAWLARAKAPDAAARNALTTAHDQVALALTVAPTVTAPQQVTTKSATIYDAAAGIEKAAQGL